MTPAMAPIAMAAKGVTAAQEAVIPTRPASTPLKATDTSGLPNLIQAMIIATIAPTAAATVVFMTISETT